MNKNRETGDRASFLAALLKKKADTQIAGDNAGIKVEGALKEVDRQIRQAVKGNLVTGEGVTKSGEEN
jgi:hypothetical protein